MYYQLPQIGHNKPQRTRYSFQPNSNFRILNGRDKNKALDRVLHVQLAHYIMDPSYKKIAIQHFPTADQPLQSSSQDIYNSFVSQLHFQVIPSFPCFSIFKNTNNPSIMFPKLYKSELAYYVVVAAGMRVVGNVPIHYRKSVNK